MEIIAAVGFAAIAIGYGYLVSERARDQVIMAAVLVAIAIAVIVGVAGW